MDSVKIEGIPYNSAVIENCWHLSGDSRASIGCSTAYTVEIQMICPERAKSKPPTERYEIIENIGSGSYGYVCKALCKKSGETVAIKIIELEGRVSNACLVC